MVEQEFLEKLFDSKMIIDLTNWVYKKSIKTIKKLNKNGEYFRLTIIRQEDYHDFLVDNFKKTFRWASTISFRDSLTAKNLDSIFVSTDLYLTPRKLHVENENEDNIISFNDLFQYNRGSSLIILGQPGAGKTTTLKKIYLDYFFRVNKELQEFRNVIVIQLKTIENTDDDIILLNTILNSIGIYPTLDTVDGTRDEKKTKLYFLVSEFLDENRILLILDGYDEIANQKIKDNVIRSLRTLSTTLSESKFILTSRSGDFDFHLENTNELELCPLSKEQIEHFIENWILDKKEVEDLLQQLKTSPYWDTTMKPLTLAHLCALYERNKSIPDKPKSVYKKIISLLVEDWSNQRSIKRTSKYSNFTTDRKMDFLSRFAYELTVVCNESSFNSGIISLIYGLISSDFNLPPNESKQVIREIESHTGLIVQTNTDRFEFAHKSLQEFLVGDYMVKLPNIINKKDALLRLPNELAIMISLSSTPGIYFYKLICETLNKGYLHNRFLISLFSRLKIEKPDWRPNLLLPITILEILNTIHERIAELGFINYNTLRVEEDDFQEYSINAAYIDYTITTLFLEYFYSINPHSYSRIFNYYNLVEYKDNNYNKNLVFKHYSLWMLVANTNTVEISSNTINLPKKFIIPNCIKNILEGKPLYDVDKYNFSLSFHSVNNYINLI